MVSSMVSREERAEEAREEEQEEREGRREEERRKNMHQQINEGAYHERWIGSNMTTKGKEIGLRAATNNFQRKLYGSKKNTIELIKEMGKVGMNVMLATEPGQGTKTNTIMFKNTVKEYGYAAITCNRDDSTIGGGMAMITDEAWSKLAAETKIYEPMDRGSRGRAIGIRGKTTDCCTADC